jgi:uncharacterized protein YndB with AHSA1/START domain
VKDVSPNSSTLVVTGEFGGFTPQELFDHWVRPELLVLWWPREAVVDPRVGGEYQFTWPQQEWVLTGSYTSFDPGRHLRFTWAWNHDVDRIGVSQVNVEFEPVDAGTRMTVTHGPWQQTRESQDERQGVLEGWIHFGMRLAGLRRGEAT